MVSQCGSGRETRHPNTLGEGSVVSGHFFDSEEEVWFHTHKRVLLAAVMVSACRTGELSHVPITDNKDR